MIYLQFGKVLSPFTNELWLLIIALMVVAGPTYLVLESFDSHGNVEQLDDFGDDGNQCNGIGSICASSWTSVYLAYGMFTGQAGWSPKSLKGRAMAATWGFLMLVLISSYTANLAAQITKRSADYKPASLDEFVNGPFKACTLDGSAYTQWLKSSEQYGHVEYVEGAGTDEMVKDLIDDKCDGIFG